MRKPTTTFTIVLSAAAARICNASVTSRLQVHIPQSLKREEGYDHRDALFGIPPYGGSIAQQVYYADSNLCDPTVDKTAGYPRRKNSQPWQSPFILMVDRGGCTFVLKVRNAQRAGAAGVLIADNTCLCTDLECLNKTNFEFANCEAAEPIMADDGSGSDISIPSFLIFKQDADPIKDVLKQNQQVRVEMKFSVPSPDSRVEYDLWTSPKDVISREFLRSFKKAAIALGKDASFTPHEYVYDGIQAGCQDEDGEDECANLCTNEGKYCTNDPDEDIMAGASGADMVEESLRRLCIWREYGKDGVGAAWWDYVNNYQVECQTPDFAISKKCIQVVMVQAGIEELKVNKCMQDSGGLTGNVNNTIFDKELGNKETQGVFILPSLYINQAPIRGELSFSTAFKAICAGYAKGYEPDVCYECADCNDEETCVEQGYCGAGELETSEGVPLEVFLGTFAALVVVFGVMFCVMTRRQERRMDAEIRQIVAEYMPVDPNRTTDTGVGIEDEDGEFTIE